MKRPKIKQKEARVGPFKKINNFSKYSTNLFLKFFILEGKLERLDVVLLHPLVRVDLQRDAHLQQKMNFKGSGCGSVGRAVASDTRGPWFESSRGHYIY